MSDVLETEQVEHASGWSWQDILPHSTRAGFEIVLLGSVYGIYSAIRSSIGGREAEAIDRGMDIVRIEQAVGLFHEEALQDLLLQWPRVIGALNILYSSAHLPPLAMLAAFAFCVSRRKYVYLRTAFLISSAIGLTLFWAIPTAPPRLLPVEFGFVDTLKLYGPFDMYKEGSSGAFVNLYAAMPSLHFAWATLLAVGFGWVVEWRWYGKLVAIGWPAVTLIVIEATGNHFFLDAAAGLAVMTVSFALTPLLAPVMGEHMCLPPFARACRRCVPTEASGRDVRQSSG